MLRSMSFDVVLCAQQMPRRSWEELFVLTRQKGIPFVLLTQESGRPESIRSAAGQDSPWFVPASEEELLSLLARIGASDGPPDDGYNED